MGTANNILSSFKTTMGVLRQGCYLALVGGVINIILTLILARMMGLPGVYLATIISEAGTTFFPIGYYTFHDGFHLPWNGYVLKMVWRMLLTLFIGGGTYAVCSLFGPVTWFNFIVRMFICAIVPNLVLFILFGRSAEFEALLFRVKGLLNKLPIFRE